MSRLVAFKLSVKVSLLVLFAYMVVVSFVLTGLVCIGQSPTFEELSIVFAGLLVTWLFASIGACFLAWLIADKGILDD